MVLVWGREQIPSCSQKEMEEEVHSFRYFKTLGKSEESNDLLKLAMSKIFVDTGLVYISPTEFCLSVFKFKTT